MPTSLSIGPSHQMKWAPPARIILFIKIFPVLVLMILLVQISKQFTKQNTTAAIGHAHQERNAANHKSDWENIQSVSVFQSGSSSHAAKFMPPVKLNLDQVRNGTGASPVVPPAVAPWVNGNAGASNAHYAEGYSIPYRCVADNLPAGSHSIDIEWDTRQSNSSAIDFVTNYDFLDYPAGSHVANFGHVPEVLNPLAEVGSYSSGTSTEIPAPDFTGAPAAVPTYYAAVMATTYPGNPDLNANKFSIFNGNITSMSYISEGDVTAASGSTRLRIFFTNASAGTVVIAWGGHIAKGPGVWGDGNSAAAVSGSPYHTRLIEWDPDGAGPGAAESIGNQDRSLSAEAVLDPPTCGIDGPSPAQCNTNNEYTTGGVPSGYTFAWSLTNNTSGASFVGTPTATSATVNAGGGACNNKGYTLVYTIYKNGVQVGAPCTKTVTVTDNTAPTVSANGTTTTLGCNPSASDINLALGSASASDNCATPSVSSTDGSVTGTCTQSQTRTFIATDACGNTTTTSRTVTWTQDQTRPTISANGTTTTLGCNPAASDINNALGSATATDNCSGAPTITPTDGPVTGTCTRSQTRTFTARDGCGNTATTSRTVTWTNDNTPPSINCGGPISVQCAADVPGASTATVTTSDNCSGAITVTHVSDVVSNSTCANRFTITRTYQAKDACNNTATCAQTITVNDNTRPSMTCPGPVTVQCSSQVPAVNTGSVTTTDNCAGTVTVTHVSDAISNSTCPNRYTITRTYRATDACGNTNTCSQAITVNDNTPPVITSCPADVIIECNASSDPANTGSATASDNCGTVTPNYTDQSVNRGCIIYITRTWKAEDACGNTATCMQRITKRDDTPPVICNNNGTVIATDNCTAQNNIVLYFSGGVWTAIDESGNVATSASPAACPQQGGRMNTSNLQDQTTEVVAEQSKEEVATKADKKVIFTNQLTVEAFPNPFTDQVRFVIKSPEAGYGSLDVMNMLGQKVKTVFQGQVNAGMQSFEMSLPQNRYSTLFYIVRVNGRQVSGKLIQRN